MSWGAFYYYPPGASSFTTITIPRMTKLDPQPFRRVIDATSLGGCKRLDMGGGRRVRVHIKALAVSAHETFIRQMKTLETYLRAGGRVALAPVDGAWGSWTTTAVTAQDTVIFTIGSQFPYQSSPSIPSGTEITVEGPASNYQQEFLEVNTVQAAGSGTQITPTSAVSQTFGEPTFVRNSSFFPCLYLDESEASDGEWFTNERNHLYEVDITLIENPGEIAALQATASSLASSALKVENGGLSINGAVNKGKAVGTYNRTYNRLNGGRF